MYTFNYLFVATAVALLSENFVLTTKLWVENSFSFMDTKSWEDRSPPCILDKILFPEEYSAAVFMPMDLEISGIILPKEGAILIPLDANIRFSVEKKQHKTCKNRNHIAKLKEVEPKFWFDPTNWKLDPNVYQSAAIPHIERIPCYNEEVVINHRGALAIDLDETEHLYMGDLVINGEEMSARNLENFIKTELGQTMFQNADETKVKYFTDESICGCYRHGTLEELQRKVCKYMTKSCEIPHCLDPIVPIGHCCPICGSIVKLHVTNCNSFNLKLFHKQVKNAINSQNLKDILDFYAGMVDDGIEKYLQLIIVDKNEYNERSTTFMGFLNETLLKHTYSDRDQTFYSSGMSYTPGAGVSGWVFIFVPLVAVLVFFIFTYAHYIPENRFISVPTWIYPNRFRLADSPFVFARFENATAEAESSETGGNIIMNVTYKENEEACAKGGTTSFDNPMFSEKSENIEEGQDVVIVEQEMINISLDDSLNVE